MAVNSIITLIIVITHNLYLHFTLRKSLLMTEGEEKIFRQFLRKMARGGIPAGVVCQLCALKSCLHIMNTSKATFPPLSLPGADLGTEASL